MPPCRALLRVRLGDIAKGMPVTSKMGRLRFDEAAKDLIHDYRVNGRRSLSTIVLRLELHLTPFFGGRRMTAITTADVRAYTDGRLRAGAAAASVNRELAIVKRMYVLAMQAEKLLHRPHIPMLREDNVRQGFFEAEEFAAVRAALPEALQPVVTFAYLTGWRIPSEVLTLEWRQVDFAAGIVRLDVGTTKNRDGRVFPFDVLPELKELLERQRDTTRQVERECGQIVTWVFHRRRGKPVRDFRDAWDTACKVAGSPARIPHDFRRTAVRNLVRAGVPEHVAMILTGHKTRSVFDRYDIVNEADLRTAIARLAARTGTKRGQYGRSASIHSIDRSS